MPMMQKYAILIVTAVGIAAAGVASVSFAETIKPSLDLAEGLIDVEQYDQAGALLDKIIADGPAADAKLDILRGRLSLAHGNPVRALEYFDKASTRSLDREAEAYLYVAEAKMALGQIAPARHDALLALKSDPDLVAAELVLAEADKRAGHAAEALAHLEKLSRARPDDVDRAIVLARFVAEGPGRGAAIAELQEFVKVHPDAAAADEVLGGFLWSVGFKVEALQARIAAGELYLTAGKTGRAVAMATWIKAVDGDGRLERQARGEASEPAPPAAVQPPVAQPQAATQPLARAPSDEPPPAHAAPQAPPPTTELLPNHNGVSLPTEPSVSAPATQAALPPAPATPVLAAPEAAQPPAPLPVAATPPPEPERRQLASAIPEPPRRPSVVPAVILSTPEPLPFAPGSTYLSGSGIVLEGGRLIVTNRHVIEGMESIYVRNGTGHVRQARVIKISREDDLALLEIETQFPEGAAFQFAELVDPAPGRSAVVMGFPLVDLLGDNQPALTEGIVAKTTGLGNDPKTFQMTTKINKGNSGGPVFDRQGRLMGVTVGQTDAADIYRKTGFMVEDMNIGIKADRILHFLGRSATATPVGGGNAEMNLEDLYQMMLPRVVLVAAQR